MTRNIVLVAAHRGPRRRQGDVDNNTCKHLLERHMRLHRLRRKQVIFICNTGLHRVCFDAKRRVFAGSSSARGAGMGNTIRCQTAVHLPLRIAS